MGLNKCCDVAYVNHSPSIPKMDQPPCLATLAAAWTVPCLWPMGLAGLVHPLLRQKCFACDATLPWLRPTRTSALVPHLLHAPPTLGNVFGGCAL